MAAPPHWGYDDLTPAVRSVLAHGLATSVAPVVGRVTGPEWSAISHTCARHGLDGLLVAAVADGVLDVGADARAEAARLEIELTRARMGHEAVSLAALAPLDAADVEVCLLKGPALAALDYPDVQWRPTSDLDLLVRASQIDRAVEVLVAAGGTWIDPEPRPGYVRLVGKGATVAMPGGLEVDLHRILVWGPFGVRVPDRELWEQRRTFLFAGAPRTGLSLEAALLHAAAHLLVLGAVRAREVRDVGQLLCSPALDHERLLVLARRWGQEALLATAVRMADQTLGLVPGGHPLSAWAEGYPVTLRDRLWLRTEQPVGRLRGLEAVAVYAELADPAARDTFRRATVAPAADTWPGPVGRLRALGRRLTSW